MEDVDTSTSECQTAAPQEFTGSPGVNESLVDKEPVKVFEHVFSPDVVDHMVKETNRYGEQYVESRMDYLKEHPRARAHDLVKTRITLAEMFKFLALVITMGIVNLPGIQHYWSTSWPFISATFSQILSRDRFLLILKFLHLANNDAVPRGHEGHDRLFKVRWYIDKLVGNFKKNVQP